MIKRRRLTIMKTIMKSRKGQTYDIGGLDVVLVLFNLLLQIVNADFVVLNYGVDLELLHAVADVHELGDAPQKARLLNGADVLLHLFHVGFIICKLKDQELT